MGEWVICYGVPLEATLLRSQNLRRRWKKWGEYQPIPWLRVAVSLNSPNHSLGGSLIQEEIKVAGDNDTRSCFIKVTPIPLT